MAKIKNEAFRNKKAIIGSYEVQYDADGVAEVTAATAASIKGIAGFEVLPEIPEPTLEIEPINDAELIQEPLPEQDFTAPVEEVVSPEVVEAESVQEAPARQPVIEVKKNKGGRPRKQ